MARRKQKQLPDPGIAIGLLIGIGVIWLVVQNLQQIGLAIFVCGATTLAYLVIRNLRHSDARRTLLQKIQAIIEEQKSALVRRRAQLVVRDAYGRPQMEKWTKEIGHFIAQQITPSLTSNEWKALKRGHTEVTNLIETRVAMAMQDQPAFQEFSDDMTPAEFESFCAEQLRRAGWDARVTMQSRDQGVDVVAEKADLRVVIQCKKYARPVGNKCVQEVAAARAHEQARYGIVVTNNRYTPAAEQLASTNGILLLHYSDLQNLHNLLKRPESRLT